LNFYHFAKLVGSLDFPSVPWISFGAVNLNNAFTTLSRRLHVEQRLSGTVLLLLR